MTVSLANKYRPQTFGDVVGQENIVTILSNQVEQRNIKHGYLFSGGAGTGKTTCARIFAKAINLISDADWDETKTVVQTGEIIEIDAASNNGVDNVRELRENSRFKPINGGYKVYIIDECHMLSTGAWNALLKVLEEPPEHVVFLLCTTDPQKIPATILSRVQRFQFKRMDSQQLEDRLEYIIDSESLDVEVEAVQYISKIANGGMRDAISVLDTCISYKTDGPLTLDDVYAIVGSTDYRMYIDLIFDIRDHDAERVIDAIEQLHNSGKDLKQFVRSFIELVLDVEKYNIVGNMEYLSVPAMFQDELDALIKEDLYDKWFDRLVKLNEWIKYDPNPKVLIEGAFLALCDRQ